MHKEILKEVGLSDREIQVYSALLTLGSTTTGPLVKISKVQNAKIYETLEKLMSKGLATYVVKGRIKHFQPCDPNTLMNIFEDKKESLSREIKKLKSLAEKEPPVYEAKIYEGIAAIKTAFNELYVYVGKNAEYCVFPIGEQLATEELKLFWAQVLHKQRKLKIRIKTLPNKKLKNVFRKHYSELWGVNIRYTEQDFPTGIFIFKNHVLSIMWGDEPVGFLIKSKENSERWQKFFNEQWDLAT